jgi:glucose-1-phosphate thymidylyltransferase
MRRPKGIVVVPSTAVSSGPWLDATRATSLQRVANRPIICHVLDSLLAANVTEVAVVSPPDVAEEITVCVEQEATAGLQIHHLVLDHHDDPVDAALAATDVVGDAPCVLHRADGLLGQPFSPFVELLRQEEPDVLLLVQQDERSVKPLRLVTQMPPRGSKLNPTQATIGVAGVCLLGPGALERISDQGPSTSGLDFTTVAECLADGDENVQVRVVHKWRHFTGDVLDLLDMNRTVLDGLAPETTPNEGEGNRFEGCIAIHPTACVMSSVLVGPVIVGADALVTDSYIGPHTSIGERVRVEGAEIERSIIFAGASVLHVGGRLVASVVGRDARIFRDFSMPRALRLQVGDGDKVALC